MGWRYIFYFIVIITGSLGTLGLIVLPRDRVNTEERARMDYFGAVLSMAGLILLQFVLSGGGVYGWDQPFIIVLLILGVAMLVEFVLLEKYISNPLMPLSLWKIRNFAGLWVAGFSKKFLFRKFFIEISNMIKACYGSYQNVIYYIVLAAQQVDKLSAGDTALRFLPMGVIGFIVSLGTGKLLEYMNGKYLLPAGLILTVVAPIPSALTVTSTNDLYVSHNGSHSSMVLTFTAG